MPGGRPRLPDIHDPSDLDANDLEIIAILEVDSKATCRSIADKVGKSHTFVWERIRRIRSSDWVAQMRNELQSLSGDLVDAVKDGVSGGYGGTPKDRASIAINILRGLGVLSDRHEHTGRDGERLTPVVVYMPSNGRDDTEG